MVEGPKFDRRKAGGTEERLEMPVAATRRFQLILVKPSHYDDDGYVIRWWRAMIPSNSLAAVYGIAADCAEREVLGPDVAIDIEAIDETNTRVDMRALLARLRRNDNFGLLALVGVQSNQYPRALDIARGFREAGVAVAIGGFHVSGCLSMLDGRAVGLDACRDLGISIFAGEAEGRLEAVLQDAAAGQLAPIYNFMSDLPAMQGTAVVVNEVGEIGLDNLVIAQATDNVVLLDAGCLCCANTGALHETLADLNGRRARGEIPPFARVIIETSGAADPAPLVNVLLGHPLVTAAYAFEATVCVVDAQHFLAQPKAAPLRRQRANKSHHRDRRRAVDQEQAPDHRLSVLENRLNRLKDIFIGTLVRSLGRFFVQPPLLSCPVRCQVGHAENSLRPEPKRHPRLDGERCSPKGSDLALQNI